MNPCRYGQVVSGEDFCPRPKLIKELTAFIESRQNVALMGERRTGKNSLICEAVRCLKKRRMRYVDLLEIKTSDDLCKRLLKAVLALQRQTGLLEKMLRSLSHLRPSITLDPLTGQPSISQDFLRAVGIPAAASVQRALNRLAKLKVIYRHEGRSKFVNPFFKSWLIYKDF